MQKAALYCRVSTEEQAELGTSIKTQEETGKAFIQRMGLGLYRAYIDHGWSGSDFKNRPELNRLRQDAAAGCFQVVVVHSIDRLGRAGIELLHLVYKELGEALGIKCLFIEDGLDSSNDRHRLTIFIKAELADEFRRDLTARTRKGRQARVVEGNWVGGPPPLGWELDREHHRLVVCEKEAEVVRYVRKLFEEGNGILKIPKILNREGVPVVTQQVALPSPRWCQITRYKKKSKSCYLRLHHKEYETYCVACIEKHQPDVVIVQANGWGTSTISRILHNPLCTGTMVWGRKKRTEGSLIAQPEETWLRAKFKTHEALISEEQFQKHKARLKANYNLPPRVHNSSFLLTGIIFCECGASMIGKTSRSWKGYCCHTRRQKGVSVCDNKTLNIKEIEPFILSRVREFLSGIEDESYFNSQAWKESRKVEEILERERQKIEQQINDNSRRRKRLVESLERGLSEAEDVKERLEELVREKQQLEGKILEIEAELKNQQENAYSEDEIRELAKDFDANWEEAEQRERKELLRNLVHRITVYKSGKIEVVFRF